MSLLKAASLELAYFSVIILFERAQVELQKYDDNDDDHLLIPQLSPQWGGDPKQLA